MMTYNEIMGGGFTVCLPQQPRNIDNGVINRLRGILKCRNGKTVLHACHASFWMVKHKGNIVDCNGDLVTTLDPDIDMKLVVDEDINLYFALKDEGLLDDVSVYLEIIDLGYGRY